MPGGVSSPASRRSTLLEGLAESRLASTQPAEPPPTMMVSNMPYAPDAFTCQLPWPVAGICNSADPGSPSRIPGLRGANVDGLGLEIRLQRLAAGLAAVAAHLVAAERHLNVHRAIAVHPDVAGADRARHLV